MERQFNAQGSYERAQIYLNNNPVLLEKLFNTLNCASLSSVAKALKVQRVDIIEVPVTSDGSRTTSHLCLVTNEREYVIPFSWNFEKDGAYNDAAAIKNGMFYIKRRRAPGDPANGPFTGEPYVCFGYAGNLRVLSRRTVNITIDDTDTSKGIDTERTEKVKELLNAISSDLSM